MTQNAIEIFRRAMTMLERRNATDGDALMLAAMFVSYVRQQALRCSPNTPREDVERDILDLSYQADSIVVLQAEAPAAS